jgi:aryl carrier-like protein
LLLAAGRLWTHGVAVGGPPPSGGSPRRRVPLPTYPFQRRRYWLDPLSAAVAPLPPPPASSGDALTPQRRARGPLAVAYSPPRDDLERRLTAIWEELIAVAPIGVDDPFFELGGDSVSALRIAARARDEGIELAVRDLFERPTIALLAGALRPSVPPPASSPAPPPTSPAAPPPLASLASPPVSSPASPTASASASLPASSPAPPPAAAETPVGYTAASSFGPAPSFAPEVSPAELEALRALLGEGREDGG